MNQVMRLRESLMMSKAGLTFVLLSAWALPASGPSGIRRKAWRELAAGICGERENLSPLCQGRRASGYDRKCQSTEAGHRGGASHSSVECPVIEQERRGCPIWSIHSVNRQREERHG